MLDDVADRTLPREDLAAMVQLVRPDWRLREATPAEPGWTALYHLRVETQAGQRTCVLKASPDDDRPGGIPTEARIQTIVDEHTTIPVPTVIGAVDVHDGLRTP